MHAAFAHFVPVLAAEKSKTPFYIAGGVLVAWALLVSVGLGMRRRDFPRTRGLERLVMAVTAALVLVAVSMAVITSGGSKARAARPAGASAEGVAASAAPPSAGPRSTLAEAADPSGQLRFTAPKLSARAGSVTVRFSNGSPLAHNFTLASGATVLGHTPTFQSGTKTLTLSLKPGTYKFFCTVPGHREAGMEGTLTVS